VRILYFADIRFPLERANGIQTMETCYALAERGHAVHLVVRPDTHVPPRSPFEYYGLAEHTGLRIEQAPATGPGLPAIARRIGYLAFAAGRAAGSTRSDVVVTRDLAVASLLLRLPARPPVVYESHGYAPDVAAALPDLVSTARAPGRAKLDRLARREAHVWRHADGYVTITASLGAELGRRFGSRERLATVPDGARIVDPQRFGDADQPRPDADYAEHADQPKSRDADYSEHADQPKPPDADHADTPRPPLTVGYAGHLYVWKGVDVLLEALAAVPGVQGLIIGGHEAESDLGRLRALATRLRIDGRVSFTGHVPPCAVPSRLARADVLALPNPASAISTLATSPLKLFEYMAAGRPIVASDLPAIREVLTHERNGWLVPPGDPRTLADGIRRLSDDPALRNRLARAALESVAEYSWARRAERLEALFEAVLTSRR
jgi:glycosyltransferase involved in cell wall biosynthesis